MQYLTLAVDASCDLPKAVFQRLELSTLPLAWLSTTTELQPDNRTAEVTDAWYQKLDTAEPWMPVNPITDPRLSQYLDDTWLLTSDGVLLITPSRARHPGYNHWNPQAAILQPQLDRVRHAASVSGHFRLRVVDSGQSLAAYGLLVQEVARMHRDLNLSIDRLRLPMQAFSERIHHFFSVPAFAQPTVKPVQPAFPTLPWWRRTVMQRQGTVPLFQARNGEERLVGKAPGADVITHVVEHVCVGLSQNRLNHSAVNASYAGPVDHVQQHPAIRRLHQVVSDQGGHLWLSRMAGSSAVLFGAGAFSVAFVN